MARIFLGRSTVASARKAPDASADAGKPLRRLVDESIPETDDRLDLPAGLAKLAPQPPDVDVD